MDLQLWPHLSISRKYFLITMITFTFWGNLQ